MTFDNKLRIGIIGIGQYAAFNHIPRFRDTDRAKIVAISRRNPERLALAKKELNVPEAYPDWQEMLDHSTLDAVVICTPNHLHAGPATAALERGLHVLVEKPMALTSQDAQSMIQSAQNARRILMVGYNARGMASWRAAKQVLAVGTIGQIRQVSVTCCIDMRLLWQQTAMSEGIQNWLQSSEFIDAFIGDIIQPTNWHFNPEASGGGSFVDIGTHVMDLMLWLADSQPVQVMAFKQPIGGGKASVINTQVRLADGAVLSLTFNDSVSGGDFNFYGQDRLSAYGDQGLLTADWTGFMATEAQEIWVEFDGVHQKVEDEAETITPAAAFVATILDDAPNIAPASEAAQVVALSEATYQSIDAGNSIQIREW